MKPLLLGSALAGPALMGPMAIGSRLTQELTSWLARGLHRLWTALDNSTWVHWARGHKVERRHCLPELRTWLYCDCGRLWETPRPQGRPQP